MESKSLIRNRGTGDYVTEPVDAKSRRELFTKLLPYVAVSAIKVGLSGSPLNVLTAAATRYNEEAEKAKGLVRDLLPLIPGFEKLQITVVGSKAVSLVLRPDDLLSCAELYLGRVFKQQGSDAAPTGLPQGDEAEFFDYALRLPLRSVYLKMVRQLGDAELSRFHEFARKANPAEMWIVTDAGKSIDQKLDPVFLSESKILRGRIKSVFTTEMLREFFGGRFAVSIERLDGGSSKVTLRLLG